MRSAAFCCRSTVFLILSLPVAHGCLPVFHAHFSYHPAVGCVVVDKADCVQFQATFERIRFHFLERGRREALRSMRLAFAFSLAIAFAIAIAIAIAFAIAFVLSYFA